jgi:hypothetical protein
MPDETVEQWVIRTRRAQGLPDHVEDEAVLAELAQAVLEAGEEKEEANDRDRPTARPGTTA